jgi:excisionase family DNA binding protein
MAIDEAMPAKLLTVDTDVLTLDEVAAMLKQPRSSIYRMTAARQIPHFKIKGKRRVFFSRIDISEWWLAQKVPLKETKRKRKTVARNALQKAKSARA